MSEPGRSTSRDAFGPAAPSSDDDAHACWARAVLLGGQGRYAAAETLLRALRTGPGVPDGLRAHAAVTRASHLRQVGAHGRATGFDAAAARLARPLVPRPVADVAGTGAAAALGDALTGLAADAIGRWDAGTAERMLHRAAPWCGVPDQAGPPPVSRTAVRWLWVRAETSLLAGDAESAVRSSGTAHTLADELGSPRHVLKSRLVHAVARAVAGRPVAGELDEIAADAGATGHLPLHWAALLAAADLGDTSGARAGADGRGRTPGGGAGPLNGRHAGGTQGDTLSRQTVAQSRRHAAMSAMNVIYLRSDPVVRTQMRESARLPGEGAVPY